MTPNRIKKRMMDYGLLQADVARLCHVSRSTVHDIVHGNRRSRRIEEFIALHTGTTADVLFPPRRKRLFAPPDREAV